MPKHVKPCENCELINYNTSRAVWIVRDGNKQEFTYYLSKHDGTVLDTFKGFWFNAPANFKRINHTKLTREHRQTKKYIAEIKDMFDFDGIKQDCIANMDYNQDSDQVEGLCFLGTHFSLMPSGKYFTAWTTNQDEEDEFLDICFNEALETVFSSYGMFITSGEGDPCDLFAGMVFSSEDNN